MDDSFPPRSSTRAIVTLARVFSASARALNATGTLIVLALVMLINTDVISRNLFNAPFRGSYEIVQFLMVMIVFLQLPDVIRTNNLTRSDGFIALLAFKTPKVARVFARTIDTASAIFMIFIACAIWPEFHRSWASNSFFGTPGIFTAPYWPIHLVIIASSLLAAAIFVTKVLSGRRRPDLMHTGETGA